MCEEQSVDDLNVDFRIQVEPRYNELLYHEDLGKQTIFFAPNNSKIKGREAQFNKTSIYRRYIASPMALCYIEVPLCKKGFDTACAQQFRIFFQFHKHV